MRQVAEKLEKQNQSRSTVVAIDRYRIGDEKVNVLVKFSTGPSINLAENRTLLVANNIIALGQIHIPAEGIM